MDASLLAFVCLLLGLMWCMYLLARNELDPNVTDGHKKDPPW